MHFRTGADLPLNPDNAPDPEALHHAAEKPRSGHHPSPRQQHLSAQDSGNIHILLSLDAHHHASHQLWWVFSSRLKPLLRNLKFNICRHQRPARPPEVCSAQHPLPELWEAIGCIQPSRGVHDRRRPEPVSGHGDGHGRGSFHELHIVSGTIYIWRQLESLSAFAT